MNISDDEENLNSVMKSLKKKIPKDKSTNSKILINDNTNENEFSLPNQGDSLTFDDMLGDFENNDDNDNDGGNTEHDELILDIAKNSKKLKEINNLDLDDDEKFKLKNSNEGTFAIPLPINIQKRHDRRAAYDIQKDQVNRWRDIIAQNRDKKTLNFTPNKIELDKNSAFKTDENDININDFESKLNNIIDESNLESKKTEDLFENIETAKLSKSEMIKRTNELRLMRELMYRGMKDSKRLKKIKSKAYRRQMRKEKLKENMLISQANRLEGIESDNGEDEENDALYQRAKERMTLKHKNTSQWAKQMIKSGMSKDKSTRDEMEEMLRQNEKLRNKQLGKGNNESSEDERELSDLENDVENMKDIDNEKLSKIGKGVLAMDFMKNAEERDRLAKLKDIENLKKFQNGEDDSYNNEDDDENSGVNININSGRRVYTPSALVAAEESRKIDEQMLEDMDEEDSRLLQNRLSVKEREQTKTIETNIPKRKHRLDAGDDSDEEEVNPWLVDQDNDDENNDSDDEDRTKSSSKIKVIDASSSRLDKSSAKIAKKLSKRKAILKKEKGENDDDDSTFTKIENKETLQIIDPKKSKSTVASKSDDEYESDGNGEDDIRMFKQSDLIKQAFAGDDVLVEEFEQEKHEIEEDEGDKQVDVTVPGWGSWAGTQDGTDDGWGMPKSKKRKIVKTIQGVVSKDKRMDKGKNNVIINEKVNKKNVKYQADKVPYPYKTWEEYERSLRVPLGREWTTTQTHSKMIVPSVITKFGSVIDPLKAPFSEN
ncbi:hypothetical protein C6P42_001431 [Pichia californica]|nr:hypothetical protein C6P42_001431 [[Candida] californica]